MWLYVFIAAVLCCTFAPAAGRGVRALQAAGTSETGCLTQSFVPGLCQLASQPAAFPEPGKQAMPGSYRSDEVGYAVLCYHDHLTLADEDTRSCLRLALSVLATKPRHPMFLLLPENTTVDADYQHVASAINLRMHRFSDVQRNFYYREKSAKHDVWTSVLSHRFGKLQAWRLPLRRVVLIDSDTIVLRNLDHLFLAPDSLASNCWIHRGGKNLPHDFHWGNLRFDVKDSEIKHPAFWLRRIYMNAGIIVMTPSEEVHDALQAYVMKMLDKHNGTWTYNKAADQPLFKSQQSSPNPIVRFGLLPCTYQAYPDICWIRPHWISDVLEQIQAFHYTHMYDFKNARKLPATQYVASRPDNDEGRCQNIFGAPTTMLDRMIDKLAQAPAEQATSLTR